MSDEIERRVHLLESAARRAGSDVALNGATFEPVGEARTALLTAIAALRAERDELAARLEAAEKAAGHSEFYSWPLTTTISRALTERDAAQAEVARLREALQFYADREHLSGDDWSKWDWADPEAANWLCPDSDESLMVEDGWMARAALESKT